MGFTEAVARSAAEGRAVDVAPLWTQPTDRELTMLNPGDRAPDFIGRDHLGDTVRLSDFEGKTVVLWFFPKADTPG
jgi:peroxiredoxin Q/BCP